MNEDNYRRLLSLWNGAHPDQRAKSIKLRVENAKFFEPSHFLDIELEVPEHTRSGVDITKITHPVFIGKALSEEDTLNYLIASFGK